jgi:hypothetical protein
VWEPSPSSHTSIIYITGAISATVWRPHDARVGICHHHHAHTTPPSSLHHSDRVPGGTRWGRGGRPVPPGAQSRERRRGCTELGTAAKIQKCPFFFSFFSNHNHLSPFFASSHSIYIHYIPCGGLSDIPYYKSWHTRRLSLGVRRSLRISVSCCRLKMEKLKFFYMKGVSEL